MLNDNAIPTAPTPSGGASASALAAKGDDVLALLDAWKELAHECGAEDVDGTIEDGRTAAYACGVAEHRLREAITALLAARRDEERAVATLREIAIISVDVSTRDAGDRVHRINRIARAALAATPEEK